ncbi:MAG: U32 family peptidase, partial [Clostridia bacterium]|nr:U32 family peptidase [Clostridia bacterium]
MLKAAVAGGADAVYLGLDRFNARRKADNFTEDNFGEVISYCHLRGVKVYVAFNTLVKDGEFSDAKNYVDFIVNSNADGIILQDMGILYYVHSVYPDFPIHVSTQAGISTVEGARFMKNLGASRVVLARETSLEVVKQIHQCVDIEIEYFVQGALCVCYSGNCYMSSIIDGNSGNRGLC